MGMKCSQFSILNLGKGVVSVVACTRFRPSSLSGNYDGGAGMLNVSFYRGLMLR